jgi:hypothetical protein
VSQEGTGVVEQMKLFCFWCKKDLGDGHDTPLVLLCAKCAQGCEYCRTQRENSGLIDSEHTVEEAAKMKCSFCDNESVKTFWSAEHGDQNYCQKHLEDKK